MTTITHIKTISLFEEGSHPKTPLVSEKSSPGFTMATKRRNTDLKMARRAMRARAPEIIFEVNIHCFRWNLLGWPFESGFL